MSVAMERLKSMDDFLIGNCSIDKWDKWIKLYVPFDMKNRVKHSGCRWNAEEKCWMATQELIDKFPYLEKYDYEPEKIYYDVSFKRKEEFKKLGGRFDFKMNLWYVMSNQTTGDLGLTNGNR